MTVTEQEVVRRFVAKQLLDVRFTGDSGEQWRQYFELRIAVENRLSEQKAVQFPWRPTVVGLS